MKEQSFLPKCHHLPTIFFFSRIDSVTFEIKVVKIDEFSNPKSLPNPLHFQNEVRKLFLWITDLQNKKLIFFLKSPKFTEIFSPSGEISVI